MDRELSTPIRKLISAIGDADLDQQTKNDISDAVMESPPILLVKLSVGLKDFISRHPRQKRELYQEIGEDGLDEVIMAAGEADVNNLRNIILQALAYDGTEEENE